MKKFDIDKVYNAYIGLDKKRRQDFIRRLNAIGIPVTKIEAYTYPEAPGIRHLFFYLKDSSKIVPYYLLPEEQLDVIQKFILNMQEL